MIFKEDSHLDIFPPNTNICSLSILKLGEFPGDPTSRFVQTKALGQLVCKIQYLSVVMSMKFEGSLLTSAGSARLYDLKMSHKLPKLQFPCFKIN